MPAPPTVSSLQLAFRARQARAQQPDATLLQSEPIAIVGLSCRFPGGGESPEAYWRMLREGVDAITEVPADRWPVDEFYDADPAVPGRMSTRWGGFLERVDGFDPQFFGIAPREAAGMDPQQRLLLEVAIEALDDAGLTRAALAGSQTGVFAALYGVDYGMWHMSHAPTIDAYTILGTAHCIASGRLSFLLDLRGPSLVVDTGCSSSLVALHLACQSLRAGECSTAVAASVGLMLSPEWTISLSKWGFMAPDGRCKVFDRRADGFVRGEGCGAVVLRRLADALADGDRVLAIIRGTAVNEDGRSTVLTSPNGPAQEAVIRQALANGRVQAAEVTYVEAHGTGTALGDPIELEALASVYGHGEGGDRTACRVGSVKANIGHLEAAAGMAGLIKTVLALQHGWVPPQLHLKDLTPHASLEDTRLKVSASGGDWAVPAGRPRFAGVSSFGFGGTNAHAIVEEAPRLPEVDPGERAAWLLPISARSEPALRELAARWRACLAGADAARLRDLCFTASVRRTPWEYRAAVAGKSAAELADALDAVARGEVVWNAAFGLRPVGARRPGPVFVFSGQGPQWWGMGRGLSEGDADYRRAIDDVAALMDPLTGWSLVAELGADEAHSRMHQTEIAQPALFAMQVALVAALRARGIEPAAVVGHSVGEIAAAHVAGVLTLDQAVRIVVHRGRVMQRATGGGRMVSVALGEADAASIAASFGVVLSVAAINAPRSTVLSGATEAVNAVIEQLEARGVGCRMLPVDYAFHSMQMQGLADDLLAGLAGVVPEPTPAVPLLSTVTGHPAAPGDFGADYWVRNMVSPVRFADAIAWLQSAGHGAFVEVGPHPVLAASMREGPMGELAVIVGLQHRSHDAAVALAAAAGHLFVSGHDPAWSRMYAGGRVVSLPAYPWQRQRYWIDRPVAGAASRSDPSSDGGAWPWRRLRSPALAPNTTVFGLDVSDGSPAFLADHRIQDAVVFPGAGYVAVVLAAAREAFDTTVELIDVSFGEPLVVGEAAVHVQVILVDGEFPSFRVVSLSGDSDRSLVHASGRWRVHDSRPTPRREVPVLSADAHSAEAHYAALAARGCQFGPSFRRLSALSASTDAVAAAVDASAITADLDRSPLQPGVLDACFQAVGALLPADTDTYVPFALASLQVHGAIAGPLRAEARLVSASHDALTADIHVVDPSGAPVLDVRAMRLQRAAQGAMQQARVSQGAATGDLLVVDWDVVTPAGSGATDGRWLLVGDDGPLAARLAVMLEAGGHVAMRVAADDDWLAQAREQRPTGVVFLAAGRGPLAPDAAVDDIVQRVTMEAGRVLSVLKWTATATSLPHGVWVVTRGAQATGREAGAIDPTQAVALGMARVAASEYPGVACRRIDLEAEASVDEARLLVDLVTNASAEPELAFRQGDWLAPRLVYAPSRADAAADAGDRPRRLEILTRGSFDHLRFAALDRRAPGPGEVEVRVRATGLNFRDVLNVLGMYPGEVGHPGDDFAGIVTAVGPDVADIAPGDAVVGLSGGAFATHVTTRASRLVSKPASLTFAHAAAVPSTFMTASWALHALAGLRAGERVLIHAAAGGVGLAAVQLARRAGAEIFATAGSDAKRGLLRSLGVPHVMSSRSGDFADEIMAITGGRGVDIVLNSLSGDLITRSLACLGQQGRFIEIGRTGVLDAAEVARMRPDVHYHVLFLLDVFDRDPLAFRETLSPLLADVAARRLSPLPARTFALDDAVDAFRFMANARHVGKVVVVQAADAARRAPGVRANATYIVTGAYGALGLRVVDWLLDRGARHLLLVGRHDPPAASRAAWSSQPDGASVVSLVLDVAAPDAQAAMAAALEKMPAPAGILHLAGVLGDGVIAELSPARLASTLAPKVAGTWQLHRLTAASTLDFFGLFSGGTALLGLPGQAAYAGANAFLDGFAHYRHTWDLPALSIAWGPWAEVGMAAAMTEADRRRFTARGLSTIPVDAGLKILGSLIERAPAPRVAVLPVDWTRYVREAPATRALVDHLLDARPDGAAPAPVVGPQLLAHVQAAPAAARFETLSAAIRETALRVLGLPVGTPLDPQQGLRDVGLDSLTALELRNRLQQAVGLPLAATLAFDYPTVAALTRHLAGAIGLTNDGPSSAALDRPTAAETADLSMLTDAEAEALLAEELSGLDQGGRDER